MIAVIQRVTQASVTPRGREITGIGEGLLILLGIRKGDNRSAAEELAEKIAHLRIFEDEQGRMNRSLLDIQGHALVVSQFTLLADTTRGRRPGFDDAAPPSQARVLYDDFIAAVRSLGIHTETGEFGAHMQVKLINNGPVTLILESRQNNGPSR